jgi:hypothetical protein
MPETIEQALENCLEKLSQQSVSIEDCLQDYPQYRDQLAELLPLTLSLKALNQVIPSETFSKNAANRLSFNLPSISVTIREALRHIFQRQILNPIRRFGMLNLLITLVVAVSLLAGGMNFVQASAPGGLLYPLDHTLEQIRLRITADPLKEAQLRIQYANERLSEAELRLGQGQMEHALAALTAYDDAIVELVELVENQEGQVWAEVRTMAQEALANQAGTLDRLRLSWPEDAQARNAFQHALQRTNQGVEQLFGPPESVPQGPSGQDAQGPNPEAQQGPNPEAPQGPNPEAPQEPNPDAPLEPNPEAPQGPNPDAPQEPNPEAPQEPNPDAPQEPNPDATQGPNPEAPGEPTKTPNKGSTNMKP